MASKDTASILTEIENDHFSSSNINSPMGSVLLRKKIDTQKEQPQEEVKQYGRYAKKEGSCNFFMFSPPEFSLDDYGHLKN